MSDIAIRVDHLSKRYRIGAREDKPMGLVSTVRGTLASPFNYLRTINRPPTDDETLWALRDVSFVVEKGEAVGVIGRNGAGKSTLLKILSRIVDPTDGHAEIRGRVGSLLEVGTGFHPELTGRENIYLNGAILGMKKTEIARRFEEIVAFAEVEKFLDTPVKRYSSGMYVRLAFAVAAHLEPEIMLVDEVLAVGDVAFQRKCLGKMGDVARQGRTVLFVSHNMSAIQRLCAKSIYLDMGKMVLDGETTVVVRQYVDNDASVSAPGTWIDLTNLGRIGSGQARFRRVLYRGLDNDGRSNPISDRPLEFQMDIDSDAPRLVGSLAVTLYDSYGVKLVNADTMSHGREIGINRGSNIVRLRIHRLHLEEGTYTVGLWLANPGANVLDHVDNAFRISITSPDMPGFGVKPQKHGLVTCEFSVL